MKANFVAPLGGPRLKAIGTTGGEVANGRQGALKGAKA
jgi:hypothetical protein